MARTRDEDACRSCGDLWREGVRPFTLRGSGINTETDSDDVRMAQADKGWRREIRRHPELTGVLGRGIVFQDLSHADTPQVDITERSPQAYLLSFCTMV